ncbi:MAG: hypothetical protein ACO1QB_13125 [Verrucomicrobiales bacterium]
MKKELVSSLAMALIVAGCSPQGAAPGSETSTSNSREPDPKYVFNDERPRGGSEPLISRSEPVNNDRTRQLTFLNRIREADPQFKTIDKAVMNDRNELGIILDGTVNMDDIPALMRSLIKQMASEFPDQNLTILAYSPSNPPVLIGTGKLNAQTRDMTYTPAQPNNNRY